MPATAEPYGILVTGIGGTGVVTIGALIGMAAHLEGKGCSVLDMTGLAQKNGAVVSHVRIADTPEQLHATRIAAGEAKLVLACDILTGVGYEQLAKMQKGVTRALVNTALVMPAGFTRDPDLAFPRGSMEREIEDAVAPGDAEFLDATKLATGLMGDSIATNLFMVGFAYQRGLLPVSEQALLRAIELNGTAIESNKQSFVWGRRAAVDPAHVTAAAIPSAKPESQRLSESLDEIIARRAEFLTAYQDAAYAKRYTDFVARVRDSRGRRRLPGATALTEAVARYYFKLLAIKDEYEVARLYAETDFAARVAAQFEGDYKLTFHLAPPVFNKPDPATGEATKSVYGPWMMRAFGVLAKLRRFRGTALDVFGRTAERRMERALIGDYETLVAELLATLAPHNHSLAVELAQVPEQIRGYGHVKERHVAAAKAKEGEAPRGVPRGDARGAEDDGARGRLSSRPTTARRRRRCVSRRRFRRASRTAGSASRVGAPASCSGGWPRTGALAAAVSSALAVRIGTVGRTALEHLVGQPDEVVLLLDRLLQANRVLGGRRAQREAARAADRARRHDQRLERHRRLLGAFAQIEGGEEVGLARRRLRRSRAPRAPSSGHRDAPRILPDVFDPDVDPVADARLEPAHDHQRPAHGLVVADGDERARRHLAHVADGRAQTAAGRAAVLELPEVMRHAELERRRRSPRPVAVSHDSDRRLRVSAVDGDRDLLDFRHRRGRGRELLLLLVPQHPHDVAEADDGLDRRRHGLSFAAAIDARRPRRVVAGDLAQQLDLAGAAERRRDAHADCSGSRSASISASISARSGDEVEIERVTQRRRATPASTLRRCRDRRRNGRRPAPRAGRVGFAATRPDLQCGIQRLSQNAS